MAWALEKLATTPRKQDFLSSFELFNALRAGFSSEVRAGGDFESRATVFLQH
jgi:hypothetical protein